MRTITLAAAVAVLLALAPACTQQEPDVTLEEQVPAEMREGTGEDGEDTEGEPEPEGELFTFVAVDIDYGDAPDTVPAGALAIELVNEGNLPHNVVFEGVQDDAVIAEAEGGGTATGEVQLDAGTYTYYCSIPGHREAGMEGELDVE